MILHCIGEHLLLRADWTVEKLAEVNVPVPMRITIADKLVQALNLEEGWFSALCFITDPEYLLIVINQLKYLWFLCNGKQITDKGAISRVFAKDQDLCQQHFRKHKHNYNEMFADTKGKVQEKCEQLLQHFTSSRGKSHSDSIDRLWIKEQKKTKESLETTLTKCYARFKTQLEEQWEKVKGYPARKGNECNMRYSISPEDCSIILEEVESLTQHDPHLVEDIFLDQAASSPIHSGNPQDVSSSTIPPFQIPAPEQRAKQSTSRPAQDISRLKTRSRSTSSTSKRSEEPVSSSGEPISSSGDCLFGGQPTRNPSSSRQTSGEAASTCGQSEANIKAMIEEIVIKYLPNNVGNQGDSPLTEKHDTAQPPLASDREPDAAAPCETLEEPLPETLESVHSTTSQNLGMLLDDMELLDAAKAMETETSTDRNVPEEKEKQPKKTKSKDAGYPQTRQPKGKQENQKPSEPTSSLNFKKKSLGRGKVMTRSERKRMCPFSPAYGTGKMKESVGEIEKDRHDGTEAKKSKTIHLETVSEAESECLAPIPSESQPPCIPLPKKTALDRKKAHKYNRIYIERESPKVVRKPTKVSRSKSERIVSPVKTKKEEKRPRKTAGAENLTNKERGRPLTHKSKEVKSVSATPVSSATLRKVSPVIRLKNSHKVWCADSKRKLAGPSAKPHAGGVKLGKLAEEGPIGGESSTSVGSLIQNREEIAKIGEPVGEDDSSIDFVEKVSSFSLLPSKIERTSEFKSKTRPNSTKKKRRVSTDKEFSLVDVSEDDDSLPDPDLSLDLRDLRDNKVIFNDTDSSILPL